MDTTESEQIDYAPDWDEDQRRGYRAYKKAKNEGKSEREALNLAFKHAQKDMPEYANDSEKDSASAVSR